MRRHSIISLALFLLFWEGGFLCWALDCPNGSIQTHSPIFYFGESIDLNCALDPGGSHQVFSESKLYFKSSKIKKDQDFRTLYGTPLDNSARPGIAIHDMVNQTASKENKYMHYMCFYDSCFVDEILVEIEYRLKPPKSGSCMVFNWERMECYWDLLVEYRQLHGITDISVEYFNTSVEYSLTTEKWTKCPSMKITDTKLTCVIEEGRGSALFMGHYYFLLIVNNTKTLDSVISKTDLVSDRFVKPAKVYSVTALANKTSIHVTWSVDKRYRPQLFKIRYTITPDLNHGPEWKEVNSSNHGVILKDLKSYRNYTIWIAAIPLVNNMSIGFWSNITYITNNTLQDVPSEVPKMQPGFYHCVNINCSAIIIFWKQISKESRNGIITKYRIIKEINGTRSPPDFIKKPSAVGYQVSVNNKQSTRILLNVATEVGFSAEHDSFLIVPPLHLRPPYPENVIVEALQSNFVNISWTAPKPPTNTTYTITNFSIMWCIGDKNGCKGEIKNDIVRYKKTKDFYWRNFSLSDSFENYAFGISVDAYINKENGFISRGRFISSGIQWSKCPYAVDAVPQEPVNIDPVMEDPETRNQTMLFKWSSYTCQKHRVGPVLNFSVAVCIVVDESCQDSMVVVLNGNQTSYRVKNLSGGKKYKITVTAGFKGGNSPPAQFPFTAYHVLFNDKPDHEGTVPASGGVPLGVIMGILVAVVAVAGFVFIAWRIRRCLRTSDRETAIEVPTINSRQERSTVADSIQTENVPLLQSSGIQSSSTPTHTIPNGTPIPNMHENPYYKPSEHYYYTCAENGTVFSYVSNDSGDHARPDPHDISLATPGSDGPVQSTDPVVEATTETESNSNQISESVPNTSGFDSSAYTIGSYSKAVPQTDTSVPLSSENPPVYTSGLSNNGSYCARSVNEFGYCPNV